VGRLSQGQEKEHGGNNMKSTTYEIRLPSQVRNVDEQAIKEYFRAVKGTLPLIKDNILDPTEDRLKQLPGISLENYDGSVSRKNFHRGSVMVEVETKPQTHRPKYEEVVSKVLSYLGHVDLGHENPSVVRVAGDDLYLAASALQKYVVDLVEVSKEGKSGFSQKIEIAHRAPAMSLEADVLQVPVIPEARSVLEMEVTEDEVIHYLRAKEFVDTLKARVSNPVAGYLELNTGFSKENPPAEHTIKAYQFGSIAVHVEITPYKTTSYGKVIDTLVKDWDKEDLGKNTGDLVVLAKFPDSERASVLMDNFDAEWFDDRLFVRVGLAKSELEQRIADYTSDAVRFDQKMYVIG
jgi:hypothetical protein